MPGRRVLVLGSGGREHALALALARSASVAEVLVAPGNPGCHWTEHGQASGRVAPSGQRPIANLGPEAVVALAQSENIDLVVVGPEAPLCAGVVDALGQAGIAAFGPSKMAAQLEGSKVFMKRFASRHGIPTANYLVTEDIAEAEGYIDQHPAARVVKADGLAGGKGAIVTKTAEEAKAAARSMLIEGAFGEAGKRIVIEDKLPGAELSVHAISDGERLFVLPVARDHKRIGDGDQGPNTGGMGAFAPLAVAPEMLARIEEDVLQPTLDGMRAEGHPYRGVLYAGLMLDAEGRPQLLEHNVRFGDPETQVLFALIEGDVAALMHSAAQGKLELDHVEIRRDRHAIVVVLAAAGYPSSPRKGDAIEGLQDFAREQVQVFHAGIREQGDRLLTSGGRVAGVTATGDSASDARIRAYQAVDTLCFSGMQFRTDIATTASHEGK